MEILNTHMCKHYPPHIQVWPFSPAHPTVQISSSCSDAILSIFFQGLLYSKEGICRGDCFLNALLVGLESMCQAGNCFIIGRDKDHKFAYCIPCYPQYAMQCTSWYYWLLLLEETDDKNALSVHNNKKIYDEVSSGWPQWLCFLFCMCLGSNKH